MSRSTGRRIIMVMGVQRSGTSALFNSLMADRQLTAWKENADSLIYHQYRLRPLTEIARHIDGAPGAVLLKPLSETFYRSIEDLLDEYREYDVRVVWIYRDLVNVLASMCGKGWIPFAEIERGLEVSQWVRRNRLALQFQERRSDQIEILRYEDCVGDRKVFRRLNARLGVKGKSLFREDNGEGRTTVPLATQAKIDAVTIPTLLALDQARTLQPRAWAKWKRRARAWRRNGRVAAAR